MRGEGGQNECPPVVVVPIQLKLPHVAGLVKEEPAMSSIDSGVFGDGRTSRSSIGGGSPRLIERKLQLTPYAQEPFRGASSAGSVGPVGGGTQSSFDARPVEKSLVKSRDVWSNGGVSSGTRKKQEMGSIYHYQGSERTFY